MQKYRELFEKLDNRLQKEIRDDKIWKFYSQNKNFDIDSTKQEVTNLNIRSKAQQAAMDNLLNEKNQIQKEYQEYKNMVEQRISSRVYRKIEEFFKK